MDWFWKYDFIPWSARCVSRDTFPVTPVLSQQISTAFKQSYCSRQTKWSELTPHAFRSMLYAKLYSHGSNKSAVMFCFVLSSVRNTSVLQGSRGSLPNWKFVYVQFLVVAVKVLFAMVAMLLYRQSYQMSQATSACSMIRCTRAQWCNGTNFKPFLAQMTHVCC